MSSTMILNIFSDSSVPMRESSSLKQSLDTSLTFQELSPKTKKNNLRNNNFIANIPISIYMYIHSEW